MKARKLMAAALAAAMLSGCYQEKTYVSAWPTEPTETEAPIVFNTAPVEQEEEGGRRVAVSDCFTSRDGTTEYSFQIDQEVKMENLAVVEVAPKYATGEDARRVMEVLLPEAEFYAPAFNDGTLSQAEIHAKLDLYQQYADAQTLQELYGRDWPQDLEMVNDNIDQWTRALKRAPAIEQSLTDWTMRPEERIPGKVEKDAQILYASTYLHDVKYTLVATDIHQEGRKSSTIRLNKACGGGDFEDWVYRSRIFRTEKPTEQRVEELACHAEQLLNQMELGQWKMAESWVEEKAVGDIMEYEVHLRAVPVLNGTTVLASQSYATHGEYFMTNAYFKLSANGELYYFSLDGPIEVKEVLRDQMAPMSMEQVMKRAKEYLTESSSLDALGDTEERWRTRLEDGEEKIIRRANITGLEFGLGRVRVPNTEDRFYYMPVVGFLGTTEYVGADSGTSYGDFPHEGQVRPLLWVNTADGGIVR